MSIASIAAAGWNCGQSGHSVICNGSGVLTPHQQYPAIYVHITAMTAGHFKSCAQVTLVDGFPHSRFDPNLNNNKACAEGDVTPPPSACLRNKTGMPVIVTGAGTASTQPIADQNAISDWSVHAPFPRNQWIKGP